MNNDLNVCLSLHKKTYYIVHEYKHMKHFYDTQLSSDTIKVILICSDIKLGK